MAVVCWSLDGAGQREGAWPVAALSRGPQHHVSLSHSHFKQTLLLLKMSSGEVTTSLLNCGGCTRIYQAGQLIIFFTTILPENAVAYMLQ